MIKVKYMKGEIVTALLAIGVAVAIVVGVAVPYFTKKNDTPLEQAAEAFIKNETGVEYDFSPEDPKSDKVAPVD